MSATERAAELHRRLLLAESDVLLEDVEILRSSGHPGLDRAAREALRRWLFEPAREDGQAVAARVLHQVVFRLD